MASPVLNIKIIGNSKKYRDALKQSATATEKFKATINTLALPATVAFTAISAGAYKAIQSASELEQSMGATKSVFGKYAEQVQKFAKNSANSVGLSKSQYMQMASVVGAQLKSLGYAHSEVAGETNKLISLASDLSATFGGPVTDAVSAISSLLRGERNPIERYGIAIKQSDINARLAEKGMGKLTGSSRKLAEAQQALAMLVEQSGGAVGQFARESNTLAGQTERLKANFEDLKAELGTELLPIGVVFLKWVKDSVVWLREHKKVVQIVVGVVATLAAGLIVLKTAFSIYTVITSVGTALASLPLLPVIAGVAAVAGAVYIMWQHWDTLKPVLKKVYDYFQPLIDTFKLIASILYDSVVWAIKKVRENFDIIAPMVEIALGIMIAPVLGFLAAINEVIKAIRILQSLFNKVKTSKIAIKNQSSRLTIFKGSNDFAPNFRPSNASFSQDMLIMGGYFPSNGQDSKTENKNITFNINVSGAIDPYSTARQIEEILRKNTYRKGEIKI